MPKKKKPGRPKKILPAKPSYKGIKLVEKWVDSKFILENVPIEKKTLQKYRDNGYLPCKKFENKFIYNLAVVHRFLTWNHTPLK
jgi:hypothetical protein